MSCRFVRSSAIMIVLMAYASATGKAEELAAFVAPRLEICDPHRLAESAVRLFGDVDRNSSWAPESRFTCSAALVAVQERLKIKLSTVDCGGTVYIFSQDIANEKLLVMFDSLGSFVVRMTDCRDRLTRM